MEVPELPLDVIHHLCTALSNDLGTLYNLALSSRLYSSVALPTLYLKLVKFPSDDDEDRLEEDATSYANRLTKWSSLWKSLALSALDPTSTMINYAAYLRVLNLRDLLSFMEEFRSPRAQCIRAEFFAEKGLQNCNKTYKSFGGQIRYDVNESADSLTDIITSGTRNVTTLIRQTSEQPSPDKALHFCRWLTFMPALESLQLFLAEVFEDERARNAVVNCPNLKSLEIYLWTLNLPLSPTDPDTSDTSLAQLLSTIAGRGLEILIIKHGSTSFGHLSLSALSRYHGNSLKELEILDISGGCLASFGMAQITNLRSCILSYSGMVTPSTTCDAISQFLARNTLLERLELRLADLQDILPTAIPSLRLKYLCLYTLFNDVLLDPLWNAVSTQSDSLETLILGGISRDPDSPYNIDTMIKAIRQLHKLKVLTITTTGVVVTDGDINQIASNCRNLEEITLPGRLSDESLRSLSTLPRLTTFISQFFLSLIPLNIDRGIRLLIWVFSSLLTLRQR